jgi:predicted CoA-binding protein
VDKDAKKLAESNGIAYIENECIMIEHQNLLY